MSEVGSVCAFFSYEQPDAIAGFFIFIKPSAPLDNVFEN